MNCFGFGERCPVRWGVTARQKHLVWRSWKRWTCRFTCLMALLTATQASAEPSTPLPPLRINAADVTPPVLAAVVDRSSQSNSSHANLKSSLSSDAVGKISAKLHEFSTHDRSWVMGRLGILVTVFLGLVWVQRLFGQQGTSRLPADAVEVCGKVRLDAKQLIYLVRVGDRLLVIHESPHGVQRLAEIADPDEVQRLLDPRSRSQSRSSSPRINKVATTAGELLAQLRDHEG